MENWNPKHSQYSLFTHCYDWEGGVCNWSVVETEPDNDTPVSRGCQILFKQSNGKLKSQTLLEQGLLQYKMVVNTGLVYSQGVQRSKQNYWQKIVLIGFFKGINRFIVGGKLYVARTMHYMQQQLLPRSKCDCYRDWRRTPRFKSSAAKRSTWPHALKSIRSRVLLSSLLLKATVIKHNSGIWSTSDRLPHSVYVTMCVHVARKKHGACATTSTGYRIRCTSQCVCTWHVRNTARAQQHRQAVGVNSGVNCARFVIRNFSHWSKERSVCSTNCCMLP